MTPSQSNRIGNKLSLNNKRIGNLLEIAIDGDVDVLVHGCNCFHTMGAGIAAQIARAFPQALAADKLTLNGDRNKLGDFSLARGANVYGESFSIVNAYTQYAYFGHGPHIDYDAVANVFKKIAIAFNGAHIGYPLIGCGLAGGDWNIVEDIINEQLKGQRHTLVVFNHHEWDRWFQTPIS